MNRLKYCGSWDISATRTSTFSFKTGSKAVIELLPDPRKRIASQDIASEMGGQNRPNVLSKKSSHFVIVPRNHSKK
jgi:hypothetical protein